MLCCMDMHWPFRTMWRLPSAAVLVAGCAWCQSAARAAASVVLREAKGLVVGARVVVIWELVIGT